MKRLAAVFVPLLALSPRKKEYFQFCCAVSCQYSSVSLSKVDEKIPNLIQKLSLQ